MYIDSNKTSDIFNSIVGPRPIGWISSVSSTGLVNIAPFSYFNGVSPSPPMVMFVCNAARDRLEKDTLANIKETGEFVFNFASWDMKEAVNMTSITVPHGTDEFAIAGLEKAACRYVKAPRVADAPASMECTLVRVIPIVEDDKLSTIVVGRVVGTHVHDAYITKDGDFDFAKAKALVRLGGFSYSTISDIVKLLRPSLI